MSADRLKQLQKFYEEDPLDPFNLYALALEYLKVDLALSRKHFQLLLANHPAYLPTYYHAAKLFHDTGDREGAIALARKNNDVKTLRELRSAYDEMMFE